MVLDGLVEANLVALDCRSRWRSPVLPVIAQTTATQVCSRWRRARHEAVVVVGMFTDEVDVVGGAHQQIGRLQIARQTVLTTLVAGQGPPSFSVWLVWV